MIEIIDDIDYMEIPKKEIIDKINEIIRTLNRHIDEI